jgi:hypothetical protein
MDTRLELAVGLAMVALGLGLRIALKRHARAREPASRD